MGVSAGGSRLGILDSIWTEPSGMIMVSGGSGDGGRQGGSEVGDGRKYGRMVGWAAALKGVIFDGFDENHSNLLHVAGGWGASSGRSDGFIKGGRGSAREAFRRARKKRMSKYPPRGVRGFLGRGTAAHMRGFWRS